MPFHCVSRLRLVYFPVAGPWVCLQSGLVWTELCCLGKPVGWPCYPNGLGLVNKDLTSCREQANHLTEWFNPVPFPSACQSGLLHLISVWYGVGLCNLRRSPAFHGCSCWLGTELDWWTVMVNTLSCAAIYFSYLWYLFQLRMSKNLPVHGNCFPVLDTSPSCQTCVCECVLSSLQHT